MDKDGMGFPINSIRICIDELENTSLCGYICGIGIEEAKRFHDFGNLVLLIEEALDFIGTPQAFQRVRSFQEQVKPVESGYNGNPDRYWSSEEIKAQKGKIKTLDVIITSRQRTNWQGWIRDIDGRKAGDFSSDMELLYYLENL